MGDAVHGMITFPRRSDPPHSPRTLLLPIRAELSTVCDGGPYQVFTLGHGSVLGEARTTQGTSAFTTFTPTRYVEVRRRFLREHPGHAVDSWPLPAD